MSESPFCPMPHRRFRTLLDSQGRWSAWNWTVCEQPPCSERVQYRLASSTSFWWFEHYPELRQHLNGHYHEAVAEAKCCRIYALT